MKNTLLDRSRPPLPGPPPTVHVGVHDLFTLPNGLRVIVVQNHKLPLVNVQLRFDHRPFLQGERTGYLDLAGELLSAGTERLSKVEVDEAVDRMGATLNTVPDGLHAGGLRRDLDALLALSSELVIRPAFPGEEFHRAMKRFRSAVHQRRDDPDAIAEAVGRSANFGTDHPYGEVVTEESLAHITVDHLRAHHRRFFRPELGYLVLVGDIRVEEARELADTHFGSFPSHVNVPGVNDMRPEMVDGLGVVNYLTTPRRPGRSRHVVVVDRPGSSQAVIRVGFPLALRPGDPQGLAGQVMNTILGGGVFNARLMQNLREDKGWTYGAYSVLEPDRFNGSFTASVSVRNAVTGAAVGEIIGELERMRNEGPTASELELAKRYMAGGFARSLEDPRTVARFALNTHLNDLPADHYDTYLQRLARVTLEDAVAAAKAFLHPAQAVIFVVGDKASILDQLVPLALDSALPVTELDVNGRSVN